MRVWQVDRWGMDALACVERPSVVPGPGEVKLRMLACSLNYRDWLVVRGKYNPSFPLPLVPCSDGVGEIVAVGPGVRHWTVGQRVIGAFAPFWEHGEPERALIRETLGGPLQGTLSEELVLPAGGIVEAPEYLSDAEAATLPCAALTAWSALFTYGGLVPGQTVLVQGSGGVSIFALQFAKAAGCRVIATTSADDKASRLRALGADEVIDYVQTPAWGRRARELAGGRGVDIVIEVGGAQTLDESIQAIRPGGTISLIGILSGAEKALPLTRILMSNIRLQGILVGHRAGLEAMCRFLHTTQLRPVVSDRFTFDQVPEALEHLGAGKHFGKIAIEVWDGR